MTSTDKLDVLLIEDNPGDARLIEEMLYASEELIQRFEFGKQFTDGPRIHHETTLGSGIDRISDGSIDIDVILLDLNLPDSTGFETLLAVIDATEFVPIVVLTGLSDEEIGIKAIQRGAQDYLIKDEVTSNLLVRSIHYALERNRQEQKRIRRSEQLETLNQLNEISRDITHAVITTSTREELEEAVCERLVDSDAYRFAWIGEVNRANNAVTVRVAAGVEADYLDEGTITIEGDDTVRRPAGNAARTRSVQVMQDIQTNPAWEPWRKEAIGRGYRSFISIPIHYGEILYGVLNIYSSSPNAFSESESEILSWLGETVGHAITAIERKHALVSDTVLELEFEIEGQEDLVALTANDRGHLVVDNFVRTDEAFLGYGRAVEIPRGEFRDALTQTSFVDEFRIFGSGEETYKFEVVMTVLNPLVTAVTSQGGRITKATVADGTFRFVVEFPPGRDKRQLIELVEDHCPAAVNCAQRLVERNVDDSSHSHTNLLDSLTEKQLTALETAYSAGLFEWPRKSTGQELADRLGISPPTFNQHLRAAEQKILGEIFDNGDEKLLTDE